MVSTLPSLSCCWRRSAGTGGPRRSGRAVPRAPLISCESELVRIPGPGPRQVAGGGGWEHVAATEHTALLRSSGRDAHHRGGHGYAWRRAHGGCRLLAAVQLGRLSRNGSTAASFSAIPQTSVAFPSLMWKTCAYFHSALEPSGALAEAVPSTTTWSSLPRMSWKSTEGIPPIAWAWRAKKSTTCALPW